jgi:hypothetical protein
MINSSNVAPRLLNSSGVLDLKNQSNLEINIFLFMLRMGLPEKRPLSNIPLYQFITIIPINPMMMHPHNQESVLVLCI